MLDLSSIDPDEIANALADQTACEHHWLINPDTGQIAFWTADTDIDGPDAGRPGELDLAVIDSLPRTPIRLTASIRGRDIQPP